MKIIIIKIYFFSFFLLAFFCSYSQNDLKIGNQIWMSKNLDIDHFRNGDLIFHAKNKEEWLSAIQERKAAFFDNGVYGKLYNWYAVNDSRGLAPFGWIIPSEQDWTVLTDFLGGARESGQKLKSKSGWSRSLTSNQEGYRQDPNGINSYGFNALPSGNINPDGDIFMRGYYAFWWTSSELNSNTVWGKFIRDHDIRSWSDDEKYNNCATNIFNKGFGLAIRCIKISDSK
jgi:uncharacterized protein (TIGR02145 family)